MNLRDWGGAVIVAGGLACLGVGLFLVGCSSQNGAPSNDAAAMGGATGAAGRGGTGGTGGAAGGTVGAGGGVAGAGAGGGQGGVGGSGATGGGLVGTGGQAGGPPGYDPPQFPPLSAAPCPFAVAPASALCGG